MLGEADLVEVLAVVVLVRLEQGQEVTTDEGPTAAVEAIDPAGDPHEPDRLAVDHVGVWLNHHLPTILQLDRLRSQVVGVGGDAVDDGHPLGGVDQAKLFQDVVHVQGPDLGVAEKLVSIPVALDDEAAHVVKGSGDDRREAMARVDVLEAGAEENGVEQVPPHVARPVTGFVLETEASGNVLQRLQDRAQDAVDVFGRELGPHFAHVDLGKEVADLRCLGLGRGHISQECQESWEKATHGSNPLSLSSGCWPDILTTKTRNGQASFFDIFYKKNTPGEGCREELADDLEQAADEISEFHDRTPDLGADLLVAVPAAVEVGDEANRQHPHGSVVVE